MTALRQKRSLRAATARGNVSSATTIFFWLNDTSRGQQMVRPDAGSRARELFNRRQGRRMFETARLACLRGGSRDDRFLLSAKAQFRGRMRDAAFLNMRRVVFRLQLLRAGRETQTVEILLWLRRSSWITQAIPVIILTRKI